MTDQGMVIVKHDPSGGLDWFVRRDSAAWVGSSSDSQGGIVAVCSHYSRGYCISAFDSSGRELGTRDVSGLGGLCQALHLEAGGDMVLAGNVYQGSCDYISIKLDRNGIERWRKTYGEVGLSCDDAFAVAADMRGNCYVGGSSVGGETAADFVILRYDQGGTERWVSRFSDPGTFYDQISDLVTDEDGCVYSAGVSSEQLRTFKHTSEGTLVWEQRCSVKVFWSNDARIVRDQAGRLYVAGTGYLAGGYGTGTVLVSYAADGRERWIRGLHSARHKGIAIDPQGNVVIGGTIVDSTGSWRWFRAAMFDSAGNTKWGVVYHATGIADEYLAGLAVDRMGNTIIVHYDGTRFAIHKYDPAGVRTWVAYSPVQAFPDAVGVDAGGNIVVTGCTSYPWPSDLVVMRWDPDGRLLWSRTFGDGDHQERGSLIAFDSAGSVYLAGQSDRWPDSFTRAIITLKYDSVGQLAWLARYQGPGEGLTRARDLEVTGAGEVFLTGYSEYPWPDVISSMLTIKYTEIVTSQDGRWANRPQEFILHQNYPNPFNPSTTIQYALPGRSHVTLGVYNTLGQQVATLVQEEQEAGYHDVQFDARNLASGVYLYRLQAGDFIQSRRLLLLR